MNEYQDRIHVSDELNYIDGRLFTLERDSDANLQNGYHLILTLPPGSSSATRAVLEVQEKTDNYLEPYETLYHTEISGSEAMAALPITSPTEEVVYSRIYVRNRLVHEHRYSLYDDADGTELDPHIHTLTLMPVSVRATDTLVTGP